MSIIMCKMGVRKILKWIKTTTVRSSENQAWSASKSQSNFNNDSYQKALQQFRNRRRLSAELAPHAEFHTSEFTRQKDEYSSTKDERKGHNEWQLRSFIPGVPHVQASEIFEIGCVAGTEDRYLELVSAEWHNTRVSLRRQTHPACYGAIKADIEVLADIRHTNVLLLMATTHTDEHGFVSILESVECTLYNYVHEQGERISISGAAQISIKLADALKYCHMRGYVHGAISSHCVYFTSNGIVKLGGWEMAITKNNVYRYYEECLRTEIFKWQPPEFFQGLAFSTKSDVYGLSLLLWEIVTMRVPWSGCNHQHVEQQYTMQKHGVIMDLHGFPPCLKKLLENGLQIDLTKRTLDIDTIRRTLHRLLMIEEEEISYVNKNENNNNNTHNNTQSVYISPILPSKEMKSVQKSSTKRSNHIMKEKSNQFLRSKKIQSNRDTNFESNAKNDNTSLIREVTASSVTETSAISHCGCTKLSNMCKEHKTDGELRTSIARYNIKRLKEIIANRRKHFFHGSDSLGDSPNSSLSPNSISTNASSSHTNPKQQPVSDNFDYVLCKPASHTTNMDLKYKTSPGEYKGIITKPSNVQQYKTPYGRMPISIRDAVVQPKILHSDPQSFYESTLWRKERLICLSRMARDSKEYKQINALPQPQINNTGCNDNEIQLSKLDSACNEATCNKLQSANDEKQCSQLDLTNNDTFIIINDTSKATEDSLENTKELLNEMKTSYTSIVSASSNLSYDQTLQELRDALDRAFEIVRSTIPYKCSFSYPEVYSISNSVSSGDENIQKYKNIFDKGENESGIKNDNSNQERKGLVTDDDSFLGIDQLMNKENNINSTVECKDKYNQESFTCYDIFENKFLTEFFSDIITKFLNEYYILVQQYRLKNLQKSDQIGKVCANGIISSSQENEVIEENLKLSKNESTNEDIVLLGLKNTIKYKNYNSYDPNNSTSRYSLSPTLNQSKMMHSPKLNQMDSIREHLQDSKTTIEDPYIDDDFRDPLNDNLILLNNSFQPHDYLYDDVHNLPQTTEL